MSRRWNGQMDNANLYRQVEKYVRSYYTMAFDQMRAQKPLTAEEIRERIQHLPSAMQELIQSQEPLQPSTISEEQQEELIARETAKLLPFVIKKLGANETDTLTNDDIHRAWMQCSDEGVSKSLDAMRQSLQSATGDKQALLQSFLSAAEQGREDLRALPETPTDEQLKDVSRRISEQLPSSERV